jgi:Flp pilus assembly protein TadG
MHKFVRLLLRFATSRRGNVAMIAGLALPAFVGFCGLASESAYWYFRQRDMQGAADIGAYDGAIALRSGSSSTAITTLATTDAKASGWRSASGTITVHTPPTSGSYTTNPRAVEVIITENEQRYFTALFNDNDVHIQTRAVAVYSQLGNSCLLALDKSASGAITFWGNTGSTFTDCNVYSDSISSTAFSLGGSAKASMPCALAVGGFDTTSGLTLTSCKSVVSDAAYIPDPYKSLPAPTIPSNCTNGNPSPLTPGKYCNGLTINGTLNMTSGIYVISGGTLKINANAVLTGSNVMFYFTNGATVQMNGNATVNLSAPTSGTYSGILMYGDRTAAMATQKINGTATSVMTGALYFPTQQVQVLGNFTGANGCMQVVADEIYYSGNSSFATNCSAYGIQNISSPGTVSLVE